MKSNGVVFIVIFLTVCLLCPSCRERESYLKVCAQNNVLNHAGSIFTSKGAYDPNFYLKAYEDESVLQIRRETIFGNEVELLYECTQGRGKTLVDVYFSPDKRYAVHYRKDNGAVNYMRDRTASEQATETLCADEEMTDVAINFVKAKWKIFQDNNYNIHLVNTEKRKEVYIRRTVGNHTTSEHVIVYFSGEGSIVGWDDCMMYPDGIPENMLAAIADLDVELCQKSVEHFVRKCAKDARGKKIKLEKFGNHSISIGYDGTLSCHIPAYIAVDGFADWIGFYVIIPYEGWESEQETETETVSPQTSARKHEKETTASLVVIPPDTPENLCSDTIPAEEWIE